MTKKRDCTLMRAKSTLFLLIKKTKKLKTLSLLCQQSPTHKNFARAAQLSCEQKS